MSQIQIGDMVSCPDWDLYFKVIALEAGGYARLKGLNCRLLLKRPLRELTRINLRAAEESQERFFQNSELKIQQLIAQHKAVSSKNQIRTIKLEL